MTAVLHVIDRSVTETELQVLALLRSRSTAYRHELAAIDGATHQRVSTFLQCEVALTPRRMPAALNWAPQLSQWARKKDGAVYHAWGLEAARVCKARGVSATVVLTLLDPGQADDAARWLRSGPANVAVIAGSQVIRGRLLSRGVAADRVVVVRGGVDFGAINAAKQSSHRRALVGEASPVLLLAGPPSRGGGQFYGLWAVAIVAQIHRGLRVIMPYPSAEADRLTGFLDQIRMPQLLIRPPNGMRWAELMSAADAFVMPAIEDVCIEPIGWAMASGVAIVASAVRSITELIADKHNGFLCKAGQPRVLASRILTALEDAELRRRVTEVARGQAYEVFGVRSFVDHCERVYSNVLAGRPVSEGVADNAVVA